MMKILSAGSPLFIAAAVALLLASWDRIAAVAMPAPAATAVVALSK